MICVTAQFLFAFGRQYFRLTSYAHPTTLLEAFYFFKASYARFAKINDSKGFSLKVTYLLKGTRGVLRYKAAW